MRVKTGIPGLDKMLEGGLFPNNIYMICGYPGSGRTTFGIQFLVQGAIEGERGLYVAFTESPTNTIKFMSRYNFNLVKYVKEKKVFFMNADQELFGDMTKSSDNVQEGIFDLNAQQTSTKNLLEKLDPIIKKAGIKRLVIDTTAILPFIMKSREPEIIQMGKIISSLRQLDVTTILLSEHHKNTNFEIEHYLVQGIICLNHYMDETEHEFFDNKPDQAQRTIQIIKMRGIKHPIKKFPISISNKGIIVIDKE